MKGVVDIFRKSCITEDSARTRKLMSPFYITSGQRGEGGVRTRKRLMRTFKLARHRFGQPWLFVSSGNAKGKGALPPPFRRPVQTPPSSLLVLFLFRLIRTHTRARTAYTRLTSCSLCVEMCIYKNYI